MPHRTGNRSDARDDVLSLLRGDHDRLLEEFREFDRLQSLQANQACLRVAQRTFAELKVLAGVEQQLFYPAVHEAIADTDLIDQSEIEHARIQRLVAKLEEAEPTQSTYRRCFRTLGEYVRRHVHDEEQELFSTLMRVSIDWDDLYEQMTSRRAELAEELGVTYVQNTTESAEFADEEYNAYDEADVEEERELAIEGQH
jgi:Hemerythrin HHE cation binding domain